MTASFGGAARIVQFNWPFYAAAITLAAGAAAVAAPVVPADSWWQLPLLGAAFVAAFWVLGSIGASWLVYDQSALMRGTWIPAALGFTPRSWMVITAGFDELTPVLRTAFAESSGRAFDIYDPATMTEASIARARQWAGAQAERANATRLPVADRSVHAAVLPLSAHELRTHEGRCGLLAEVHRALASDGRVLVVEHLRDLANFAAFGPGVLHFHSRRTWLRCFAGAGLAIHRELTITPFVRVFVLGRPS
jgi:hypothetical protein